uniref:YqaJ viral recombinase domain-containing protein n=1 Tax=viral metagenome TaxID=1070528 RepID=A0A6C0B8M6_9ZZZZ
MEFNDNDLLDIETNIYENIEEYLRLEIINVSSPHFYAELIEDVTNVIHDYWVDCGICTDDDYEEVENIVEHLLDVYLDFSVIPRRSISYHSFIEPLDKNIAEMLDKINALKNLPQPKQKTKEWYEFRYNLITASNIWKALSSPAQRNSLIYDKCKPLNMFQSSTNTESAMHWGIKYEPLTVMWYEHVYQTKLDDFGCIQHPIHKCIGASPDGINTDPTNKALFGRMVEIKNIVNREITGCPKEEYWVQTQVQMETCDLDECDFVETRFKEYENEEQFYLDNDHEHKGVILHFMLKTTNMSVNEISANLSAINSPIYKYMPFDISCNKDAINHWINETKLIYQNEMLLFSTLYWYLDEYSCVLIQRNRAWFQAAAPIIEDTWATILKEREEGYQHRAAKKRAIKVEPIVHVDKIDDSTSQSIRNMPLANSICLVKLNHNAFAEETL